MSIDNSAYQIFKVSTVEGRYVTSEHIDTYFYNTAKYLHVSTVGKSVLGLPIKCIELGSGPNKILMWSQMHGNESTTTKAILDLISYLRTPSSTVQMLLDSCTLKIIPILNPDGAAQYTRVNANHIDLNRDAQHRTQPESQVLRKIFEAFDPDYCFNLHDQRTIFNVGSSQKPATISFLAPAHDEERSISVSRAESMRLIVAMNTALQRHIPGQVGRYDDAFNANCIGDTFQMLGKTTVLFEAGHYANDYQREITRKYIFYALQTALQVISENLVQTFDHTLYTSIPENKKLYLDVLIYNAEVIDSSIESGEGLGILYTEKLRDEQIYFEPTIVYKGKLESFFGHKTYNVLVNSELMALKKDVELASLLNKI